MKNERIKELKNFADDFNKRLQSSEIDSEEIAIYKKINNKNKNRRSKLQDFHSISTTPMRSKSQFKPVIKNI